jgi:hypothetical protein
MTTGKRRKSGLIPIRDERGVASVIALLVAALLYLMGVMFLSVSSIESTMAASRTNGLTAFYLSDAGIEHARRSLQGKDLSQVLDGTTSVFAGGNTVNLAGGSYTIQVANNILVNGFPLSTIPADPSASATVDSDGIIVVTSTGIFRNATQVIEAVVATPPAVVPPGVKGAVTTNGPTGTNGNITIDGRDHNINGDLSGNPGSYGLFTADTYTQSGNSKVGGTDTDNNDQSPAKPGDPSVIEENYSGTMEATPDEVMGGTANGYPEGTLKSMAQSGTEGSQYVTDPATLTFPLSGVTYVELPSGQEWNPVDFGDSNGILVVHNNNTDAVIKNLNNGTFKGLLIADDIVHIHTDIIGAVISLTTGPSSGNVIGNGSGQVLYSRQALANAIGGAATGTYSVLSWHEL